MHCPSCGFENPEQAIEIPRRQSAKSLELRVVMSLRRLWQQQGKKAEAQQLLAKPYGWFTEGFDTKDLQEAKALLDASSSERCVIVRALITGPVKTS